jgi:hypothetical protein
MTVGALPMTVSGPTRYAALVQTARGARVKAWFGDVPPEAEAVAALQRRVTRALKVDGLGDPHVEVAAIEHPAALPRTPAGKRRPIVVS